MTEAKSTGRRFSDVPPHRFKAKTGDTEWGPYRFAVTHTQKNTLDAVIFLLHGWPKTRLALEKPTGVYYSQRTIDGDVLVQMGGRNITVRRSGRLYTNQEN